MNQAKLQTNLDTDFLKLIAIAAMTIDHVGTAFFHSIPFSDGLGVWPFPFFATA